MPNDAEEVGEQFVQNDTGRYPAPLGVASPATVSLVLAVVRGHDGQTSTVGVSALPLCGAASHSCRAMGEKAASPEEAWYVPLSWDGWMRRKTPVLRPVLVQATRRYHEERLRSPSACRYATLDELGLLKKQLDRVWYAVEARLAGEEDDFLPPIRRRRPIPCRVALNRCGTLWCCFERHFVLLMNPGGATNSAVEKLWAFLGRWRQVQARGPSISSLWTTCFHTGAAVGGEEGQLWSVRLSVLVTLASLAQLAGEVGAPTPLSIFEAELDAVWQAAGTPGLGRM